LLRDDAVDEKALHQRRAGRLLIQTLKHKSRWSNPAAFLLKIKTISHSKVLEENLTTA
jgi:hypothetical protein